MSTGGPYTLYYWPEIPGRGEYVRLAFAASGVPYAEENDVKTLSSLMLSAGPAGVPPHFAPPILEFPAATAGHGGKTRKLSKEQSAKEGAGASTYLSQTPAILAYLAPRFGLAGDEENDDEEKREQRRAHVNQLVLTALDLSNETHDTHHPIASMLYYEDQKDEAKRRADDFRKSRVPKFFKYFDLVLSSNPAKSNRLVGSTTTTADLVLFQVVDGLQYAFPRLLGSLEKAQKFSHLFAFKKALGEEEKLKAYLESDKRKKYSMGLYRHYEELDGEFEEQIE